MDATPLTLHIRNGTAKRMGRCWIGRGVWRDDDYPVEGIRNGIVGRIHMVLSSAEL